jgi:hypothetical protein
MVPDVILSVGELPRGPRGKADYHAVLELVESQSDDLGRLEQAGDRTD